MRFVGGGEIEAKRLPAFLTLGIGLYRNLYVHLALLLIFTLL
jgi:hypothetical protein